MKKILFGLVLMVMFMLTACKKEPVTILITTEGAGAGVDDNAKNAEAFEEGGTIAF